MTISELIEKLEHVKKEHGDLMCFSMGNDSGYYWIKDVDIKFDVTLITWMESGFGEITGIDQYSSGDQTVVTL